VTDVAEITGGATRFGRALAEGCEAHGVSVVTSGEFLEALDTRGRELRAGQAAGGNR
jgi:hypothetical protein